MKTWLKQYWLTLLVLAVPFIFIGIVWDKIPYRMPVHFNAAMKPNGWMNKPWAPLAVPLCGVFAVFLASVLLQLDPKMAKSDEDTRQHVRKVVARIFFAFALFISTTSITLLWAAWGNVAPVRNTIVFGLPLVLLVVGNCLGKLRPNYIAGIRLPWTLESPTVWTRTHRLGGKLMVALSLILLAFACFDWQHKIYLWLVVGTILGWALIVCIYSFAISRQEQRGKALGAS